MDILDRASPSRNLGTNPKELHTPKSTSKKSKGDNGDKRKKLKFNRVLCENEAWQEADIVFQKLSKQKLMFSGKIEKTPNIWHLLQCNFFDWDWKVQNKEEFAKRLGTFVQNPNFNIVSYYTFGKFM